jgi:hypothetical protein
MDKVQQILKDAAIPELAIGTFLETLRKLPERSLIALGSAIAVASIGSAVGDQR